MGLRKITVTILIVLLMVALPSGYSADIAPGQHGYEDDTKWMAGYRAAMALYWSGEYTSAQSAFQNLLKQDPLNANLSIFLADCLWAQGKRQQAADIYNKAYVILKSKIDRRKELLPDVKEPEIYSDLAYCLNAMGRYDEAKQIGMFGSLEGKSTDLHVNMAYAFYKLDKAEIARENYCKSQQISEPKELNNLTYQRLAILFENGREWIDCPDKQITTPKGTNYALIIGVAKYRDSQIPPLKYVANDVRELQRVLTDPRTGIFKPKNTTVLLNRSATEKQIMFAFDDMAMKAMNEEDLLLIFYSGHGFTDPNAETYWLTYDTIERRIQSTAFSNLILASKIARIKAKTVVFLIDACYSSGMVNMSTAVHGLERDLRTAKDYVIITSSQANQVSLESPQLKHGLFTHFLVKGLSGEADRNGDGNVNIDELWDYINLRIPRYAKNMGKDQDPGRVFSTGRSIFISKNPNY
jgi:tetratricopeptide (TPR) repeat protein